MSEASLKGRVALVTGASQGIGRAAAIELARAGAHVVVNHYHARDEADQVLQAIRDAGSRGIAIDTDVSDHIAVEQMVEQAVDEFGKLDIAVANAAYSDREPFCDADLEGFRRTIDVTMWGAFYTLRAATRQMIRQGMGGAICIVSSPHAHIPVPNSMAYNMAKAAVEQMGRTAAVELARHRVRVNSLQPGWTDTPGERKFHSEETMQQAGSQIPLGRLGLPEEMARGIAFLCDPQNDYITGASLLIDGGITLPWWARRGSVSPEPKDG